MKLACFYHCLFVHGDPPEFRPNAFAIVKEQMDAMDQSGLLNVLDHFLVGINGDKDSLDYANLVIPASAKRVLHGPASKAENLTIVELEKWLPCHEDWLVLYFHSKGATHLEGADYTNFVAQWRRSMMQDLVMNWRQCVVDLVLGAESVGSRFMAGLGADKSQNIWAGNFFWAKASFLLTLPSIFTRERIKMSGIASAESRYEAEVWIGNGPRVPVVKQYRPNGGGGVP